MKLVTLHTGDFQERCAQLTDAPSFPLMAWHCLLKTGIPVSGRTKLGQP